MVTWPIIWKHKQCWLPPAYVHYEKNTQKPKIAKLIIFRIFFKWRHSDRKCSKVVPCMTEWPNDHFWPYFRQKAYSGGILKRNPWKPFFDESPQQVNANCLTTNANYLVSYSCYTLRLIIFRLFEDLLSETSYFL